MEILPLRSSWCRVVRILDRSVLSKHLDPSCPSDANESDACPALSLLVCCMEIASLIPTPFL